MSNKHYQYDGNNINKVVTSVGNSWIICKSRSHSGRIYYFNTLTGEAAWNLSDAEIEKAKRTTKVLENHPGANIEGCPEPKEPPSDYIKNVNDFRNKQLSLFGAHPQKIYNKEIMSNMFSKTPYLLPSFGTSKCTNCSLNQPDMNNPVPIFNPNVWSVPPTQQIFIAPSPIGSSLNNQTETSVNVSCHNLDCVSIHNTTMPYNIQLEQKDKIEHEPCTKRIRQFFPRINYNEFEQKRGKTFYQKKLLQNTVTNKDLRELLSAKRKLFQKTLNNSRNMDTEECGYNNEECQSNDNKDRNNIMHMEETSKYELYSSSEDEDWLEGNMHINKTKLKLDLTPLKGLIGLNTKQNQWFIVPDTNVLLNNLNFVKVLINSDEQCYLMVPRCVITELQHLGHSGNSRFKTQVRHATYFLTQQLRNGYAIIGESCLQIEDSEYDDIFKSCVQFSQDNYHVVLLSNNMDLQKYKNKTHIFIFTVEEIKNLLNLISVKHILQPPESLIKIIIPNNTNQADQLQKKVFLNNTNEENVSKIQVPLKENHTECLNKNKEIKIQANFHITSPVKQTIDAEVQTESDLLQEISSNYFQNHSVAYNTQIDNLKTYSNFAKNLKPENTSNTKKREIRLKRNTTEQITVNINKSIKKKNFKWRRRRNVSNSQNVDSKSLPSQNDVCESKPQEDCDQSNNSELEQSNTVSDGSMYTENKCNYDINTENSESSNCITIQNLDEQLMFIDETSTSGVISKSASNVDSESVSSQEKVNHYNFENENIESKNVMFEVTSKSMEEYLRMKCDEWISRFVQIMEEVLTQVLQQEPQFIDSLIPPPWSLHEAAQCIKKKFSNNCDVIDAANKLSDVLFKISDNNGKINMNLEPAEFMEMYSYGVYLVDTLQNILCGCEDLQTAAESLSKLMSDIQDPNLDSSHNTFTDSFSEIPQDIQLDFVNTKYKTDNQVNRKPLVRKKTENVIDEQQVFKETQQKVINQEILKYNLRSNKKKNIEDKSGLEPNVKFVRKLDIKHSFFKSLNLQRKDDAEHSDIIKSPNLSNKSQSLFSFECIDEIQNKNESNESKVDMNQTEEKNEPKIIRNFHKCLEFEERLNRKGNKALNLDELDYSDKIEEDYEYLEGNFNDEEDEKYFDDKESMDTEERVLLEIASKDEDKKEVVLDGNNNFKYLFGGVLREINSTFVEVREFCAKCRNELGDLNSLSPRNTEMKQKAEKVHLHISDLYKSLSSIFDRETMEPENNIQALLRSIGIADFNLYEGQITEYRNIVRKCIEQANILLEYVGLILSIIENKNNSVVYGEK